MNTPTIGQLLSTQALADAQRLLGDKFRQALELFVEESAATVEGLSKTHEVKELGRQAHGLKSSAGYMGAVQLTAAARALEYACNDVLHGKGRQHELGALQSAVAESFAQTRQALREKYAWLQA